MSSDMLYKNITNSNMLNSVTELQTTHEGTASEAEAEEQ
jgi:hypothetical protein